LASSPSTDFWAHEFDKHGTCAETLPALDSELKFFSATLNVRTKYDVFSAFNNAGITPSTGTTYSRSQFNSALRTAFGVDPLLSCDYSDRLRSNVLVEVGLCLDTNLRPFQCASAIYSHGLGKTCGDSVLYPPNN